MVLAAALAMAVPRVASTAVARLSSPGAIPYPAPAVRHTCHRGEVTLDRCRCLVTCYQQSQS